MYLFPEKIGMIEIPTYRKPTYRGVPVNDSHGDVMYGFDGQNVTTDLRHHILKANGFVAQWIGRRSTKAKIPSSILG